MTAQQLKVLMERVWRERSCESPLRPARWRAGLGNLYPDNDPAVSDQDDGRPLHPANPA